VAYYRHSNSEQVLQQGDMVFDQAEFVPPVPGQGENLVAHPPMPIHQSMAADLADGLYPVEN
jgi:hypothetical protein